MLSIPTTCRCNAMVEMTPAPIYCHDVFSGTMLVCRFRADGRAVVATVRYVIEDLSNAQHPLFVCNSRADNS